MAVCFAATSFAQLEIKPAVGLSFSNVRDYPDYIDASAKLGWQVGASLMAGERFYFDMGVYYGQRTTEYSFSSDFGPITIEAFDSDVTQSGLYIPVNVGFRLLDPTNGNDFNIRVFAGPNAYVVMNTSDDMEDLGDLGFDFENDAKDTYWSARVGAGVDFSILFIEAAYDFGLSPTFEDMPEEAWEDMNDIRNNTFLVNVGLRFVL